jgi:hypothetical protein
MKGVKSDEDYKKEVEDIVKRLKELETAKAW